MGLRFRARIPACTLFPVFAACLMFGGSPALAGESGMIEEIIVTAQKREQSLQEVPMSISAFTGDYLEDRQINNLVQLTRFAPSMEFEPGSSTRTVR